MVRQKEVFFVIICSIVCISAVFALEGESLFSENTANLFIKQASEVHHEDPLDSMRAEQAMTFLEAAAFLNLSSDPIPEQMLRIGAGNCYSSHDYTSNLTWALDRYLSTRSDLEVLLGALRCMLEQIDTRVDREVFLEKLYKKYSLENPAFASELLTQLGLLAVEKTDMESAMRLLSGAYASNPYNQLAFSKYLELSAGTEATPDPSSQVVQMRTALVINPYDLDSAIEYANMLMRFRIYDVAAGAYGYAAKVHQFLYPDQKLSDEILHGWLLSCYHSDRMAAKCIEVAEAYRDPDRLDLMLEVVAGRSMIKLGQVDKGKRSLESAVQKAESLLSAKELPQSIYPEYLAWFYSFIQEQPEKALAWSNQAFQESPERGGVKEIFAYAMALNGQYDLAQQYAEPLKENAPIALLAMAMIELSQEQKQTALETLRAVVEMSPESFVAEKAIGLLKEQESDYIPSVDSAAIRDDLGRYHQSQIVPEFMEPSKRFSARLLFNGSDFLYRDQFLPRLVIENMSSDALVISDEGFLQGYLRVDAVLEGSLNVEIPDLYSVRFRPSQPILQGEHLSIPLDLNCGRLRKLLMTYPQADVAIHFTAYLDPIVSPSGKIESRIKTAEPIHAEIRRRGVALSRNFLLQRLDVLSKGQSGQKYQAASLFTGLLAEQKAFSLSHADFKHVQVDESLLVDAVRKILVDKDWKIRVHTLNRLFSLSVPIDEGMMGEVSENLNHDEWPVRLMAMYLLAKAQPESFRKVLDWTCQHDVHAINRRMAFALGAQEPVSNTQAAEPTQ